MSCVLTGVSQKPAIKNGECNFVLQGVSNNVFGVSVLLRLDYFAAEICLQSALWSDPSRLSLVAQQMIILTPLISKAF